MENSLIEKIPEPLPFEIEFPEAGKVLTSICQSNSISAKKNRIIVDFDRGEIFPAVAKSEKTVGRNDPCPCGSGIKFKKCCMEK